MRHLQVRNKMDRKEMEILFFFNRKINGRQKTYLGGATLIAPNKVLTVAHKFYNTYDKSYFFSNIVQNLFS